MTPITSSSEGDNLLFFILIWLLCIMNNNFPWKSVYKYYQTNPPNIVILIVWILPTLAVVGSYLTGYETDLNMLLILFIGCFVITAIICSFLFPVLLTLFRNVTNSYPPNFATWNVNNLPYSYESEAISSIDYTIRNNDEKYREIITHAQTGDIRYLDTLFFNDSFLNDLRYDVRSTTLFQLHNMDSTRDYFVKWYTLQNQQKTKNN